jgi:predicted XRE-type DNA-binding protein
MQKDKNGSRIGSGNVFADLGFSPIEAGALKAKSELHSKVIAVAKHYTQAQLGLLLNASQPRVSDLLKGKISRFSIETLYEYAFVLGLHPIIQTKNPSKVAVIQVQPHARKSPKSIRFSIAAKASAKVSAKKHPKRYKSNAVIYA